MRSGHANGARATPATFRGMAALLDCTEKGANMPVDVKYTTRATATGGRDGRSTTEDGSLDVKLSTPKELGGGGGPGNNPEQLFAAGYAACFLGAMKFVASPGGTAKVPDDT